MGPIPDVVGPLFKIGAVLLAIIAILLAVIVVLAAGISIPWVSLGIFAGGFVVGVVAVLILIQL